MEESGPSALPLLQHSQGVRKSGRCLGGNSSCLLRNFQLPNNLDKDSGSQDVLAPPWLPASLSGHSELAVSNPPSLLPPPVTKTVPEGRRVLGEERGDILCLEREGELGHSSLGQLTAHAVQASLFKARGCVIFLWLLIRLPQWLATKSFIVLQFWKSEVPSESQA